MSSAPFLNKDRVDTLNSICWLLMDALWMFGLPRVGLLLSIPAIAAGIMLLYIERRKPINWMNLATHCWIVMNVFWMLSDTFPTKEAQYLMGAKTTLILGLAFVVIGAAKSGDFMGAIDHYKSYKHWAFAKSKAVKTPLRMVHSEDENRWN